MIHLGLPFSAIPRNRPMRLDTNLATALGSELMKNVARRQFSRTLLTLLVFVEVHLRRREAHLEEWAARRLGQLRICAEVSNQRDHV